MGSETVLKYTEMQTERGWEAQCRRERLSKVRCVQIWEVCFSCKLTVWYHACANVFLFSFSNSFIVSFLVSVISTL